MRSLPTALLSLSVVLGLLVGCSGIQVDRDYDPEVDFGSLRTWAWISHSGKSDDPRIDNALLDSRVRAAVEGKLAELGYRKLESGDPDFGVVYHAAINKEIRVDTIYRSHGYGRYGYGGVGYAETLVSEYDVGSLIIDVVAPSGQKLLWRGIATAAVQPGASPEKRTKRVDQAVDKMFKRFPPDK